MKPVWAPWRIKYILEKKTPDCFLCIPRTRGYRRRSFILAESEHAFVVLNRYPYTAGHAMVAPWRHIPDLSHMNDQELCDFFSLVRHSAAAMTTALQCEGMNMGANIGSAAGAGLADHFHFHLVARWNGDHNFMPVIGRTPVASEYLEATYERLLPAFGTPC